MVKQYNYKKREDGKYDTGRPTTYKQEYCNMMIDYFDREVESITYKESYYADGTLKAKEPVIRGTEFPSFQGFAHTIGTTHKTLLDWCNNNPEFCEAYARAKEIQESIWLTGSMGNLYNSQFAQFFGKNCLGYKDKTETELSGKVEQGLSDADRALLSKVADRISDK